MSYCLGCQMLSVLQKTNSQLIAIRALAMAGSKRKYCNMSSTSNYDIIISGGGMVGFAMASAIGQSSRLAGSRILVLESASKKDASGFPESWKDAPYSNRVCALAHHSVKLMERLGAWQHIEAVRAKNVTNMQVWESESDAHISFGDGQTPVATIVENDIILQALKHSLPSSVEVRYSSEVQEYSLPSSEDAGPASLTLKDGTTLSTDLLIGSDGVSSLVRRSMGVKYLAWQYKQSAVVATLSLQTEEDESNSTAWQKFLPTGPIALLPLTNKLSSLVWSTTPSQAKALLALDEASFTDALNNALWVSNSSEQPSWLQDMQRHVSGIIRDVSHMIGASDQSGGRAYKQLPAAVVGIVEGSRASFPLGFGHAVHYTAPKVALIGDAAHRIHPLAGQGVNLGFGDVASLTAAIEDAVGSGRSVGCRRALQRYETERQRQNLLTMGAVDGLHRLYGSTLPPAVLLRSLGLTAVDALQPIKSRIMAHAEG